MSILPGRFGNRGEAQWCDPDSICQILEQPQMQAIAPGAPVNLVLEWRLEQAAPHFSLKVRASAFTRERISISIFNLSWGSVECFVRPA
jgi:hypothetical protein